MCGIAGYVTREPRPEVVARMLAAVAHRGPDGEGEWTPRHGPWHVALGNRRLAVLGGSAGAQPMASDDGVVHVTFNGEIVNWRDLAARLGDERGPSPTATDTEVLVRQLALHGAAGIAELDGMFAFAAWDTRSRRLLLARDRAGIKPLYYAPLADGGVAFASELSALLRHPGIGRRLDHDALADYFFADYAAPPRSLVDGVRKLAPGCFVAWDDGRLSEERAFWRPPPAQSWREDASSDALASELWERLVGAVARYQSADVPIGFFVSGGIDSALVARAARVPPGERLRTFSLAFSDPSYDESGYSRMMAEALRSDHTEVRLEPEALLESVPRIADSLDEPLADPSYIATYLLCEAAARSVKVALGGDGGDELWGGYQSYLAHRLARPWRAVPRALRGLAARWVDRLPVGSGYQQLDFKLRRFVLRWDDDARRRHLRWMGNVDLPELRRLLPRLDREPPVLATEIPLDPRDPLQDCLSLDLATYLPNAVLTKVDRASMAHGLEVRPPYLANDLVDWARRLPTRYKVRGLETKWLLKRAARGRIPRPIIERSKHGFGAPIAALARGPFAASLQSILADSPLWVGERIARPVVREWLDSHRAGRADHGHALWSIFVLDRWLRRHDVTLA